MAYVNAAWERAAAWHDEHTRLEVIRIIREAQHELAMIKHELSLRRKYDPNQPRAAVGTPIGGQWIKEGDNSGPDLTSSRLFLAGGFPRIPRHQPPTAKERNAIIKAVAVALAHAGAAASDYIKESSWLYHAYPLINAYLDRPRSLGELHDLVWSPERGYDVHHIVEQTSAEQVGFPRTLIDRDDNLVRIPTLKHWQINAWYQAKTEKIRWPLTA